MRTAELVIFEIEEQLFQTLITPKRLVLTAPNWLG
jgi:hypothetical protein